MRCRLLTFIPFLVPIFAGSDGSSCCGYVSQQLTCSFLNPSDISSAGGSGGSPAMPTAGRTLLPSPLGTQLGVPPLPSPDRPGCLTNCCPRAASRRTAQSSHLGSIILRSRHVRTRNCTHHLLRVTPTGKCGLRCTPL